jgi:serine/threonine protein kinase
MGAGGRLPSRDPRVRADVLHESERTRVTRLFLPGGTVVRKELLGPEADSRLRHELAILERLRGVAGVAEVLDAPLYPGSIVLADADGPSLAGLAKPLAVDDLIGLALDLARAVAGMHGRGVMHRHITPANIVLAGDGAPCLVDFALATVMAEIRPEFTHHTEIVGTLAYLAPEQSGRTARSVDQRADLYALGATLYELAVGTAKPTWTRRIRWQRRCPAGVSRPTWNTCGSTTCPCRVSSPWPPRCCTWIRPRRRAWRRWPNHIPEATRTRWWSCSTRCGVTAYWP